MGGDDTSAGAQVATDNAAHTTLQPSADRGGRPLRPRLHRRVISKTVDHCNLRIFPFLEAYLIKPRPIQALLTIFGLAAGFLLVWHSLVPHDPAANDQIGRQAAQIDVLTQKNLTKDELIRAISSKYDLTEQAVVAFLETLYQEKVPEDRVVATLIRRVSQIRLALQTVRALDPSDPLVQQDAKAAEALLAAGQVGAARTKLDVALAAQVAARDRTAALQQAAARTLQQQQTTLAGLYASEADIAEADFDFAAAAQQWDLAAQAEPAVPAHARVADLIGEAEALAVQGDVNDDDAALARSIVVARTARDATSPTTFPAPWVVANNIAARVIETRLRHGQPVDRATLNRAEASLQASLAVLKPIRGQQALLWALTQAELGNLTATEAAGNGSPTALASAERTLLAARAELEPFKQQQLDAWVGVNLMLGDIELERMDHGASIPEIAPRAITYAQAVLDASPTNRGMGDVARGAASLQLALLHVLTGHLEDAAGLDPEVRTAFEQGQIVYLDASVPIYVAVAGPLGYFLRPSPQVPFYPTEFTSPDGTLSYRAALAAARRSQADSAAFVARSGYFGMLWRKAMGEILTAAGYRLGDAQALQDGVALLQATKDSSLIDKLVPFGQWVLGVAASADARYDTADQWLQAAYTGSVGMPEVMRGDIQAALGLAQVQQAAFSDDPIKGAAARAAFAAAIKHYDIIKSATKQTLPYEQVIVLNRAVTVDFLHNLVPAP